MSGVIDDFTGTQAHSRVTYQAVVHVKSTGAPWQNEAYYQDEYVKRDGRWLFQSRTVVPLIPPAPLDAIADTWAHTKA